MMSKTQFVAALVLAVTAAGCVAGEEDDGAWEDASLDVSAEDQADDDELNALLMDDKADAALTYVAVARLALNAGVSCSGDRIAIATAVAKAESSFRPWITNTAGNAHGIDRGLWQVNSYWHPEVSATCALSPSCNARAMARISRGGTRWSEWWTYNNGKHYQFMAQARAAKASVCGG
jgi:hypothetical protein